MTDSSRPAELFTLRPEIYARYRPTYPREFFAYLRDLAPSTHRAWDCATGSGQAATSLAEFFDEVVAIDISPEQLAQAPEHPKITYREASAEDSDIDDASVDLITVATALHWFDRPRFYAEAERVLVSGGILAAWSYGQSHLDSHIPEMRDLLERFNNEVLAPYWSEGNELTRTKYASVELPFEPVEFPEVSATKDVDLDGFLGYMRSWSASQRYVRAHGEDPVDQVADDVAALWGPADTTRTLVWPLFGRVGRNRV